MAKYHPHKSQPPKSQWLPPPSKLAWKSLCIESKEIAKKNHPELEREDSHVSLISAVSSDHSHGSLVYQDTKELFRDLLPGDGPRESIENLVDHFVDVRVRDFNPKHYIEDQDIRNRIHSRYERNYGASRMKYVGDVIPDSFGLDPEIPISQMRKILKAQEKVILVNSLRQYWNEERGPVSNWWELKDRRFAAENEKCRKLLCTGNQVKQFHARERLIECRRQLLFEIKMI